MSWNPLQLRKISFLGPVKPAASLDFVLGVNVICGASETGKSFLAEALDFLFGGSEGLRDISERIGYDRAHLSIESSGKTYTLQRSVEGGEFCRFEGLVVDEWSQPGTTLGAKHAHGREDNLSGWLLSKIGLIGKKIRRNQSGDTKSLSFRDLARLVIVPENEIIKQGSPFWTGQYVTKTSEYSVLKLLLTGVDDSALVPESKATNRRNYAPAKIELIDQWLNDLEIQIERNGASREELQTEANDLSKSIDSQRALLEAIQRNLESALSERRKAAEDRDKIVARINEIKELLARFNLLEQHYKIDVERLQAIEESGSLLAHVAAVVCPLCGAAPEDQHLDQACGGDISAVMEAAKAEIEKIEMLSSELRQTVDDLKAELTVLSSEAVALGRQYEKIDVVIRDSISPDIATLRSSFSDLVERQGEVKQKLGLFQTLDQLLNQKVDLEEEISLNGSVNVLHTDLSKSILEVFSERVENILKAWHFPGLNRVYFDENTQDFVIDGRPRGSRGKGLRAITYAACTIALMEYCKERDLPHPGFAVLDSPLLVYWKPEGIEDNLQGTDLKDRFYEYITSKAVDYQIIILENEHPPIGLSNMEVTIFTKNELNGRYGFFPRTKEA